MLAGATIKAAHVTELRSQLSDALQALGIGLPTWTDATLVVNVTLVQAAHMQELRGAVNSAGGAGSGSSTGTSIQWLVTDQLGTPRMVLNRTGSLSGVRRHDYLPFGEELVAGMGARTTQQGYAGGDGVRQQFTGYERDNETGLDFAQARYYSSVQGRFTSPDDFLKDSDLRDPQSWNKYAYVRNNPLRYIDPTGEKATITIQTDEENRRGTITITASIAIYARQGSDLSREQMEQARAAIESSIEGAWSGTLEHEGITYTVSTNVDVQVYGSQDEATNSGAQNAIGISHGTASRRAISYVEDRWFPGITTYGQDVGTWNYASITQRNQAAHEFTHIIGAEDTRNRANVSFSPVFSDRVDRYGNATAFDYRHALGRAINAHRDESRPWVPHPYRELGRGPQWQRGERRSHTSTRVVVCCR